MTVGVALMTSDCSKEQDQELRICFSAALRRLLSGSTALKTKSWKCRRKTTLYTGFSGLHDTNRLLMLQGFSSAVS